MPFISTALSPTQATHYTLYSVQQPIYLVSIGCKTRIMPPQMPINLEGNNSLSFSSMVKQRRDRNFSLRKNFFLFCCALAQYRNHNTTNLCNSAPRTQDFVRPSLILINACFHDYVRVWRIMIMMTSGIRSAEWIRNSHLVLLFCGCHYCLSQCHWLIRPSM